eukprot:COSAG01_NODE_2561_length_7452_cov_9.383925_4_plen_354_part_00
MCEPVRLCLVGCGMIADRHAVAVRIVNAACAGAGLSDAVHVVATADPTTEAAERLASHFADHGAAAFSSLDAVLAAPGPKIDAALLMVPPELNRVLVPLCLKHGVHTYVQKPIGPTPEATRTLLAEAERYEAGQPGMPLLMASEHAQWQPEVLLVHSLLQRGVIGEVISARANFWGGAGGFEAGQWRANIEGGGGVVVDGGTHYVRPLRLWLGEVQEVCGVTRRIFPEAVGETFARAILRHRSGAISTLDATAAATPFSPQPFFVVTGASGELTISVDASGPPRIDLTARLRAAAQGQPDALSDAVLAHMAALQESAGWLAGAMVRPCVVMHHSAQHPAGLRLSAEHVAPLGE